MWSAAALPFEVTNKQMFFALSDLPAPRVVDVAFYLSNHTKFDGEAPTGFALLWPYFCGNLLPCRWQASDGNTCTLHFTGVPAGKTAVFPRVTAAKAPSYHIA